MSYTPLYDPKRDGAPIALPVVYTLATARKVLDEKSRANIHSQDEMIRAATALDHVLRDLLAALDKEAGRGTA